MQERSGETHQQFPQTLRHHPKEKVRNHYAETACGAAIEKK
jgi:hypothetical protein